MELGLIGLGKMGAGIAKSSLRAGNRVTVFSQTCAPDAAEATRLAVVAARPEAIVRRPIV